MSRRRNDPARLPRRSHRRWSGRARSSVAAVLLAGAIALATAVPAQSVYTSTSGTVVGATVPSSTSIDTLGCRAGSAGITNFGTLLPGSFARTSADCVVNFGSSNDAPRLLTYQGDGTGDALAKASVGAYDLNFDGTVTGNGSVPETGASAVGSPGWRMRAAIDPTSGATYVVRGIPGVLARITRYLPNGTLDPNWDGPSGVGDGVVDLNVNAGDDRPTAIVIQADGKVVYAHNANATEFLVTRLNTNGTIDTTFGTNGTTNAYNLSGGYGSVWDLALDRNDRIYLTGTRALPSSGTVVVRLTPDGVVDSSFAGGGAFTATLSTAYASGIQPDDKLVVVGTDGVGDEDFAFARFNTDGTLDATFDGPSGTGNGAFVVPTIAGTNVSPQDIGVAGDGDIVAVGATMGSTNAAIAIRLNGADGTLDTAFDGPSGTGNGIVTYGSGVGTGFGGVLVDGDGYAWASGSLVNGGDLDTWLVRFDPTGVLDAAFDGPSGTGNGSVVIDNAPGATDIAYDLVRATDGDLVSAGVEGATSTGRLMRFDSSTIPDYANGVADWSAGAGGAFGMCLVSLAGTGASTAGAWTPDARCTNMTDSTSGTWWDDVPDNSADPDAQVGALSSSATNGVARFRFGLRLPANQSPGRYQAPITFQVLAP